MLEALVFVVVHILLVIHQTEAGMCLEKKQPNGNCFGLQYRNKTASECCNKPGNYYTLENYSIEEHFRIRISGNGYPNCLSCKDRKERLTIYVGKNQTAITAEKCKDVNCGPHKVCKFRHNTPKCVCKRPKCKLLNPSPVCSNYNKTYRTECSLHRHACINNEEETLAYDGPCRDSCKGVVCRDGKQCVQFQEPSKMPFCVHCDRLCSASSSDNPVCGADNVTYSNYCELRKATCRRGKTIGIAYMGVCKDGANCSNVACLNDRVCLMDKNRPRCVRCSSQCMDMDNLTWSAQSSVQSPWGKVCGTDERTYPNLCALRKYACKSKSFVDFQHQGACKGENCSSVYCPNGESCLMDKSEPRCVSCSMAHCMTVVKLVLLKQPGHYFIKPMCGTDQNTYPHLCALRKQACKTGKFIGIQHKGTCKPSNDTKTKGGNEPNDQSYSTQTHQIIELIGKLKNTSVTGKELQTMLQTFGLKVSLDDTSNQALNKTIDVYAFFCHLLQFFTKAKVIGCP